MSMDEPQKNDDVLRFEAAIARKVALDPDRTGFDYALPAVLAAVDAALWEFFAERFLIKGIAIERHTHTSGSVQYVLMDANKRYTLGSFHVRLITPEVTSIALRFGTIYSRLSTEQVDELKGTLLIVVSSFLRWFQGSVNAACAAAATLIVAHEPLKWEIVDEIPLDMAEPKTAMENFAVAIQSSVANQPRQRGKPADPDNEWARGEIRLGRDRSDVFTEYLRRQNVDQSDQRAVTQARNRFKKALTRQPRQK
jgi:hypothetical protein